MSYMTSLISNFDSFAPAVVTIPNFEIPSLNDSVERPALTSNIHKSAFSNNKRVVAPKLKATKPPRPVLPASAMVAKCIDLMCVVEYGEKVQLIQATIDGMVEDPSYSNVLVYRLVNHIVDLSLFLTTNAHFPAIEKAHIMEVATEFQKKHVNTTTPNVERLKLLCAMFKDTFQHPLNKLLGRTIYDKALFALCSFFIFARDVVVAVTNNKDEPLAKTMDGVCVHREWTYAISSPPCMTFQPIVCHHAPRQLLAPPSLDDITPIEI